MAPGVGPGDMQAGDHRGGTRCSELKRGSRWNPRCHRASCRGVRRKAREDKTTQTYPTAMSGLPSGWGGQWGVGAQGGSQGHREEAAQRECWGGGRRARPSGAEAACCCQRQQGFRSALLRAAPRDGENSPAAAVYLGHSQQSGGRGRGLDRVEGTPPRGFVEGGLAACWHQAPRPWQSGWAANGGLRVTLCECNWTQWPLTTQAWLPPGLCLPKAPGVPEKSGETSSTGSGPADSETGDEVDRSSGAEQVDREQWAERMGQQVDREQQSRASSNEASRDPPRPS